MYYKKLKALGTITLLAIGASILIFVDWRIMAGVFFLMWADNLSKRP